jgi:hypothetical protein
MQVDAILTGSSPAILTTRSLGVGAELGVSGSRWCALGSLAIQAVKLAWNARLRALHPLKKRIG